MSIFTKLSQAAVLAAGLIAANADAQSTRPAPGTGNGSNGGGNCSQFEIANGSCNNNQNNNTVNVGGPEVVTTVNTGPTTQTNTQTVGDTTVNTGDTTVNTGPTSQEVVVGPTSQEVAVGPQTQTNAGNNSYYSSSYKGASATNIAGAAQHFALRNCVSSTSVSVGGGSVTGVYLGVGFNRTASGAVNLSVTKEDGTTVHLTIPELADTESTKRGPFLANLDEKGQALALCLTGQYQAEDRRLTRQFEHARTLQAQMDAAANARLATTYKGEALLKSVEKATGNNAENAANLTKALLADFGVDVELSGVRDAPVAPPAPAAPAQRRTPPAAPPPAPCVPKDAVAERTIIVPGVEAVTCPAGPTPN
jgi:hypothetical protein